MQDFMKIDQGRLGGINLNNMMPIPKRFLTKINIDDIKEEKYKRMLENQMLWINKNEIRIINRARNLYYIVTRKTGTVKLIERCCDFNLLEQKCNDFMNINKIGEKEIMYIYFSA